MSKRRKSLPTNPPRPHNYWKNRLDALLKVFKELGGSSWCVYESRSTQYGIVISGSSKTHQINLRITPAGEVWVNKTEVRGYEDYCKQGFPDPPPGLVDEILDEEGWELLDAPKLQKRFKRFGTLERMRHAVARGER